MGRYITSDPIGLDGGLNTYGYATQNPLIYKDEEGLKVNFGLPGQMDSIKSCICSGGDCYSCCTSIITIRPSFSSIGICESMCYGEIIGGRDGPIMPPVCDDEQACLNSGDNNA